jgi:hypothetical protein
MYIVIIIIIIIFFNGFKKIVMFLSFQLPNMFYKSYHEYSLPES